MACNTYFFLLVCLMALLAVNSSLYSEKADDVDDIIRQWLDKTRAESGEPPGSPGIPLKAATSESPVSDSPKLNLPSKKKSVLAQSLERLMRTLLGPRSTADKEKALRASILDNKEHTDSVEYINAWIYLEALREYDKVKEMSEAQVGKEYKGSTKAEKLQELKAKVRRTKVDLRNWYQKILSRLMSKKMTLGAAALAGGSLLWTFADKVIPKKLYDWFKRNKGGSIFDKSTTWKPNLVMPTVGKQDGSGGGGLLLTLLLTGALLVGTGGLLCWFYCAGEDEDAEQMMGTTPFPTTTPTSRTTATTTSGKAKSKTKSKVRSGLRKDG